MKRLAAFLALTLCASPAFAFLGIGDITFDPTSYAETVKQYEEMVKLYKSARESVDKLASIENTLKEAQTAYDTLSSGNLKQAAAGLKIDSNNTKTVAGLRAEIANLESGGAQATGYAAYQLSLIGKLEDLAKVQKASTDNMEQSSGKTNEATSAQISAQSTAALAALAAAEEQRRVLEEIERAKAAKAGKDAEKKSVKVYEALGGGRK